MLADGIDCIRAASDSLQVIAENGKELLLDDARVLDVPEDGGHVPGLSEDFPDLGKVPSRDGGLALNVHLGAVELRPPLIETLDASVNVGNRGVWLLLEDRSDVDLVAHLLTDLRRDGVQDVFELVLVVVYVTRDGPDELEAIQERRHGLGDGLQVSLRDVLELAVKGGEELHEVLGLGVLLAEILVGRFEAFDGVGVLGVFVLKDLIKKKLTTITAKERVA